MVKIEKYNKARGFGYKYYNIVGKEDFKCSRHLGGCAVRPNQSMPDISFSANQSITTLKYLI